MILRKFAQRVLVTAGLLACWVAQANSVSVAAYGVPGQGFDNGLSALYANIELTPDNLFNSAGNTLTATALGPFTIAFDPAPDAVFALPSNYSGAWVASFSNLSLPAAIYRQSATLALPDSRDWVAALPPDFGSVQDAVLTDFSADARDYWDLLREPLAPPDFRNWLASLPPAFEIARDWERGP